MATKDTPATQLIINQLTREQYNKLTKIEDNQLYIIDENILSSANEYFKTQKDFQISAYADAAVVNKAYVTKVVDNINDSLAALTAKHDREISAKQDKLTDNNQGAYIDISANVDSSKTLIAVTNVVSAGTAISAEATQSSLTTSKAVKEYVAATVATTAPISHRHEIADVNKLQDALDAKQDNLTNENASSYIAITEATDTAPATIAVTNVVSAGTDISATNTQSSLTTSKAVKEYVVAHTGNADIHVTAKQKTDWTSTSATVTELSSTWNSAIQGGSTENSAYIKLDRITGNILHVTPVLYGGTLSELSGAVNPTGIVQPSLIKELNDKVNELHQIPQFLVVVAKSIDVNNKKYVPSNSNEAKDCVQNTVYLVPDSKAAAGAHIEYLCYGETRVIEQIGTTEIDLSDYAKTADIGGGFNSHGVSAVLSNGELTGVVMPGSIVKDNDSVVTGGAVYDYITKTVAPISHEHEIAEVNGLTDALAAKQNKLTASSYIKIDADTISVSAVATSSDNIANSYVGLTTGKAVHDYVENKLTAKQDELSAGSYITITDDDIISVSAVTTTSAAVVLGNTGLTTGNAVREALNNMIVFRKHNED